MKTNKKTDLSAYVTLTFCIALLTLPFLALGGSNIADGFRCTFVTFPANYLLYIAPVLMYIFLKKKEFTEKDSVMILSALGSVIIVLMHSAIQTNRSGVFFTLVAVIILAVIIININDTVANAVLLSGLIVLLSPTSYIFAVYIPVLLLIILQTASKTKTDSKKQSFLFFAYLYIPVLILILLFTKKISFIFHPAYINLNNTKSLIELSSGMLLLLISAVTLTIRVLPVIKNGKTMQKLSLILFAVYPFAIAVFNCIFILTSSEIKHAILLSLVMYIAGNIQISASYKENDLPLIPEKLNNTVCLFAVILIFCTFCFK